MIAFEYLFNRKIPLVYTAPAVCDYDFSGTGEPTIFLAPLTRVGAPTGLVFGGSGNFTLSWSVVPGALCYSIYRSVDTNDPFGPYMLVAECLSDANFTIPANDFNFYRVEAITEDGVTDLSEPIRSNSTPTPGGQSLVTVAVECPLTGRNGFPGVFTISRDAVETTELEVSFFLGGTAVNGTDYELLPLSATIPADEQSVDVEINPIELNFSSAVYVDLALSTSPDYTLGTEDSGTVLMRPPLVRIKNYGGSEPLLVPAPAGGEAGIADPSDGCEWDGSFNYVDTYPPAPGPEFIYWFQDSAENTTNGLVESVQGTKIYFAQLSGPTFGGGFWLWQVAIYGYRDGGVPYVIWQGTKYTLTKDSAAGVYNGGAVNASDSRATLELEIP